MPKLIGFRSFAVMKMPYLYTMIGVRYDAHFSLNCINNAMDCYVKSPELEYLNVGLIDFDIRKNELYSKFSEKNMACILFIIKEERGNKVNSQESLMGKRKLNFKTET